MQSDLVARCGGASLQAAQAHRLGLPPRRQGDRDDPGPVHPGRGGRVGHHDARPARQVGEASSPHRRPADGAGAASCAGTTCTARSRPTSVRWVDNMTTRWASCTTTTGADQALRPVADDAGLGGRLRAAPRAGPPDRAQPQQAVLALGRPLPARPSGPRATSRAWPTPPRSTSSPAPRSRSRGSAAATGAQRCRPSSIISTMSGSSVGSSSTGHQRTSSDSSLASRLGVGAQQRPGT